MFFFFFLLNGTNSKSALLNQAFDSLQSLTLLWIMPYAFDMNYSVGLSNTQRTYDFTVLQRAGSLSLVHTLDHAGILHAYQLLYSTVLLTHRHESGLPQPNLVVYV